VIDWDELNEGVVDEFRANGGQVGGRWAGAPLILVNHRGAKTGREYTTPLAYTRDGDAFVVYGSKGGMPAHPHWFLNLVAHPDVTVEVGGETIPVIARLAKGEERARLWAARVAESPSFADYQAATVREIPVVVFERR
jgi:deazaflavin-dependent oxidoreductase (nitroreductase family)